MHTIHCLGCGREIEFTDDEIGLRFECAVCGTVAMAGMVQAPIPDGPAWYEAPANAPSSYYPDPSPAPRRPSGLAIVLLAVAGACLLVVLSVFGLVLLSGGAKSPGETAGPGKTAAQKPGEPSDPWPECAAIREWFRKNTADPSSVEIVEWQSRGTIANKDRFSDDAQTKPAKPETSVWVKWRGKNGFGAMSIETRIFVFTSDGFQTSYVWR